MTAGRFFSLSDERLQRLRERRRAEGLDAGREAAAADVIPPWPGPGDPPASFAQERLWFLDRMAPGTPTLDIPAALRLTGRLDRPALAAALSLAVARHAALRTRLVEVDGRPVQRVEPPAPVPLPRVDLAGLPAAARRRAEGTVARAASAVSFRLDRAPLLAAVLVDGGRGGDGRHRHLLWVTVHHVAADGWSLGILLRDLAAFYQARAAGRAAALPAPSARYADWAAWQRRRLSGDRLAAEVAWWRERLAGAPRSLDLPADRPRAAVQALRGASVRRELPAALADRVRALGRGLPGGDASPFMVLLALFQLLVGRWTGNDDVVVGAPVAGRTHRQVEGVVGLFLNHLVLRVSLTGAPTVRELVARVRDAALGAFAHQELPFERLLEELEVERDLSRTPLFQVYFNLLSFPRPDARLPELEVATEGAGRPPSKFDLTVYADDGGPGAPIRLELVYDADLFDRVRMEEAAEQYALLLEQAAAAPERPAGELTLVTAAARRRLPDPSTPQSAAWPGPPDAALARHAAAHPERPAVIEAGGETISYGRLESAVAGLAARLAQGGSAGWRVGRGDVVAVWGHRGAALVAALLAVHRVGAAFTVLDPEHPPQRHAACLRLAGARLLLVPPGAPPVPEALRDTPLLPLPPLLEDGASWPGGLWSGGPEGPAPVGASDLACVTFTSGSTGAPKPVAQLHGSLTHFLPWQAERFGLGPDDRVSLLSGLAHDPLQRDVFTPLWVGASLAVPDPGRLRAPGYLAGWAAAAGVTVMHLTPSTARLLAETAPPGHALPSLRLAYFLGEALARHDVERLRRLAPGARCVNLYGTTETHRAVAWHEVEELGAAAGGAVLPLGRGMPDVQLLVLGAGGAQAGVGEVGEIAVRSPHLAAGYLGDPVRTAERFAPDPAGGGGRIYRTGDLGRYRPDGAVEALGRRDRQVKVRGFRVEPAEVEAALTTHPAVREAAVVARDEESETRLVAYVVLAEGVTQEGPARDGAAGDRPATRGVEEIGGEAVLRRHLAGRLPAALVPSAFVVLPELPLTANRKLDVAALPAPEPVAPAVRQPPATPTEARLAALWRDVLAVPAVGRDDDFFALGGHSLRLTRLLARVRTAFGVELPVRRAFEASTLAAQAAAVDEVLAAVPVRSDAGPAAAAAGAAGRSRAAAGEPDEPPLVPTSSPPGGWPLSFAQQRLWFLDRLVPGGTAWNLAAALDLAGPLEPVALAAAFTRLVARQQSLRTRYPAPDGRPVQRVMPPFAAVPPRVDLAGLAGPAAEEEAVRIATGEARRRLDLAAGPPLRALLLRLAPRRHRLLVTVHHVAADGTSLAILARELGVLYTRAADAAGGETGGAAPLLPELPIQYTDFALWQRRVLAGEALERRLAPWRRRLAGAPAALELPSDPVATPAATPDAGPDASPDASPGSSPGVSPAVRPRVGAGVRTAGRAGDRRAGRVTAEVPAPVVARLAEIAKEAGATRFMVLLAGLAVVLGRWSGQDDLVVGTPVSGRSRPELEPLVGLLLDLLPLRVDLAGEPSFPELLGRVREVVLEAFAHQDVPFERLLADLAPRRDPGRHPLFDVLLNVFDPPPERVAFGDLELALPPPVEREARLALTLYAPASGPLRLSLVYRRTLMRPERAAELVGQLVALLTAAAADPERPLPAHEALTGEVRRRLPDPALPLAPGPSPEPLPRRFAAVAAAAPERVALRRGASCLTYGTLAAAASRVAGRLAARGHRRGEVVAVTGASSFGLVAAALGVLEAGGVLLLVDPALPPERRRRMLLAAGARCLLAPGGAGGPRQRAEVECGPGELASGPRAAEEPGEEPSREGGSGGVAMVTSDEGGLAVPPAAAAAALAISSAGSPAADPDLPAPDLADPAYVVFTSGTTGEPKAILGTHGGLAHFLAWQRETFGVGPGDRVGQLTALSFDVVLRDLFLPLTTGAELVLPEEAGPPAPGRVLRWLEREAVTVLHAVPTLTRSWLDAATGAGPSASPASSPATSSALSPAPPAGSSSGASSGPASDRAPGLRPGLTALRRVFFAGEPLPAALVEDWRRAFPRCRAELVNLYGPAETTLAKSFFRVPHPPPPGVQPVGEAIPGAQALVLAGERRCAPGEVGEIVLRTPWRTRGYLAAPAADRARFVPNPWRDDPDDLLYRTGDLGRHRLDGGLEILGRLDRQVKVRGVRIEPAEVAAALAEHPAVAAAAVDAVDGELVAWWVPREAASDQDRPTGGALHDSAEGGAQDGSAQRGAAPSRPAGGGEPVATRALRLHLARRLPAALVPTRFVRLARLPVGANGKIDRAALPAPPAAERRPSRPPRDAAERELAAVFAEVLGLPEIGAEDGFFDLGGHSLLAVPLLAAVEERFGRRLPLAVLFERDTGAELAELLRRPETAGQGTRPAGGAAGGTFPRKRPGATPAGSDRAPAGAPAVLPGSPLVVLRAAGSRPPLHLVHPGGGGVLCFAELARALGEDQPLYALQSVGLDGEAEPLASIDAMAERYLAAMAEARSAEARSAASGPAGRAGEPWHLGGWSFGGRVAFEMARRLREAGEPVGLVALLDIAPNASPAGAGTGDDDPALIERFLGEAGGAFAGLAAELRTVLAAGGGEDEQLARIAVRLRTAGGPQIDSHRAAAALRVFRANMAAARSFRQRPYPGPVTLFRAEHSDRFAGAPDDATGGWGRLAGHVEVVTVPGDHRTMVLRPHATALAEALRSALGEATEPVTER